MAAIWKIKGKEVTEDEYNEWREQQDSASKTDGDKRTDNTEQESE